MLKNQRTDIFFLLNELELPDENRGLVEVLVGWLGSQSLDLLFGTLHGGAVGCQEQFENQISASYYSIVSEPFNIVTVRLFSEGSKLEGEDNLSGSKKVRAIVTVVVRCCGKHGVPGVGAFGTCSIKQEYTY